MPRAPVVGRVLSVQPIAGADQVRLARVDVGDRTLSIVFGGHPVVDPGCLVPVAPPGCRVPRRGDAENVKMRMRRYRNTISEGMLCSLTELGWADLGPNEVAVLRKGRAGDVLPFEGDLAEWLSDECYRRHVSFFLAPHECQEPNVRRDELAPVSPPTAPLLVVDSTADHRGADQAVRT